MSAPDAAETPDARRAQTSFVGMTVFLGGWAMIFAALLFVWADMRVTAGAWPPDGAPRAPLLYPAVATLLIAASSWSLARGRRAATLLFGVAFVVVQLAGWAALWRLGVTPSSGRYGSLLYTVSAFHALHVLVGLTGLLLSRQRNWRIFWHFVGAVWLVLFAALYLAGCRDAHPFTRPMRLGGRVVSATTLNQGRDVYQQYCRPCHGEYGDGQGVSAVGLRPPPRDFTQALFKFGHTTIPMLPPDVELRRIVRKGLNGTAMRPWDLSDDELDAVLQYIKTFSPRWQSDPVGAPISVGPDPFAGNEAAAIAAGKPPFDTYCSKCHVNRELKSLEYCLRWKPGWKTLDERECDVPVRELPPNLACDTLRTLHPGTELSDIARIAAAGVGGAQMPGFKGALSDQQLWGVAYYVRALRRDQTGCKPSRTGQ